MNSPDLAALALALACVAVPAFAAEEPWDRERCRAGVAWSTFNPCAIALEMLEREEARQAAERKPDLPRSVVPRPPRQGAPR